MNRYKITAVWEYETSASEATEALSEAMEDFDFETITIDCLHWQVECLGED